jgi:hypothetical protein
MSSLPLIAIYKYVSFICSTFIILFLLLHDWINLYPLNDLKTFNKHCSLHNKIIMTIVNTFFFVVYTFILLYYWTIPFSFHAKVYLIACNILFLIGIIFSWWLPYLCGWPKSQVKELHETHGTTHSFLPHINNNPTPNTLHVIFHLIFVINVITSYLLISST